MSNLYWSVPTFIVFVPLAVSMGASASTFHLVAFLLVLFLAVFGVKALFIHFVLKKRFGLFD